MSFRLLLNYRLGHFLANHRNLFSTIIILFLKRRQLKRYSCDISYEAKIGRRVRFPHPIGIIIGTGTKIEDDVMIWQHVTLGSIGSLHKMAYPTIKSRVKLYSSCQIIGSVTVHEGAKIGASAVVLEDVPKNSIAVGVPAKIRN